MLETVASMLRERGLSPELLRASYAAIGGGIVYQERLLVLGGKAKVVVSMTQGSGSVELRVVAPGVPESVESMLEELGAVTDYEDEGPFRASLRLRNPDPVLVAGIILRIAGGSP